MLVKILNHGGPALSLVDRNNCIFGSITSTTLTALEVVYLYKLVHSVNSVVKNKPYNHIQAESLRQIEGY